MPAGAHLQVVLLTGLQGVAAKVGLELYVVFKGLIGGREGHRGEKLNRQTTKQNKNRKEGEEEGWGVGGRSRDKTEEGG